MSHMPRSGRRDRGRAGRQHAQVCRAWNGGRRTMSAQQQFDADVARAMTRRSFLVKLARASSVAILASSSAGCGTLSGAIERRRLGEAAPVFDPVQRQVVAKIIDGFNPPDTEIRLRLEQEDPEYDPVAVYAQFAFD